MTSASVTPLAVLLLAAMLGGAGAANAIPRPQTRPAGHATPPASAPHPVADTPDPHRSVDPRREAGNATANGKGDRLDTASFGRRYRHHAEPSGPYWTARTVPPPSPPYSLAASYPPPPYVPAYPQLPGYPPLPPR